MTHFTEGMTKTLIQLVKDKEESLFPKSRKFSSAETQKKAWNDLAEYFNKTYPKNQKSVEQLKHKWNNLKMAAKSENGEIRKYFLKFLCEKSKLSLEKYPLI